VAISAQTRLALTEISAKISQNRLNQAFDQLLGLIKSIAPTELMLASEEITEQIDRFYKQKRRDLSSALELRLQRLSTTRIISKNHERTIVNPLSPLATSQPLRERVAYALRQLAEKHIFKWTPHYRDALRSVFANALAELPASGQLDSEIHAIGNEIARHANRVYEQGYRYQIDRGLQQDVCEAKSINGLQTFLDLVVLIFLDKRPEIEDAASAEVLWALASTCIVSIIQGYGSVNFGTTSGWSLLHRNPRVWVPPAGFCRGSELQTLFEDSPPGNVDDDLRVTLTAAALATERVAHGFHGQDVLLPRLSRISPTVPLRLDVTLSAMRAGRSRELLVTCFWQGVVRSEQPVRSAMELGAAAILGRFSSDLQVQIEHGGFPSVVDGSGTAAEHQAIQYLSESVVAKLESYVSDSTSFGDPDDVPRNYAKDFPLDDPDFRRQFMVERHSVKQLLQQLEGSTGIHLWCSVRRSGKTTAVLELADAGGQSAVSMQTMNHEPRRPIQNIFARRVREAFQLGREIDESFFGQVVRECVLAASAADSFNRRVVFIIDEYETLFAHIDSYSREDVSLKVRVALPLLSQMVDFSANNLLVLMGQRPDAYQVLPAQNQLSPLVQQHKFPLFHHVNGAEVTEFTEFLELVLSDKLPFDSTFAQAVFEETSGHPYLTVNLMIDFCDWLIATHHRLSSEPLAEKNFVKFVKDRLASAALKRSPHYEFFHSMMAGYLSEQARTDEPWLFAVASLLQKLSQRRASFSLPVNTFEQQAAPLSVAARMPASRLLTTGCQANFFRDKDGVITPGVKILSRLASSCTPAIN